MTTAVDDLRSSLEAFVREGSMEHYLHSSGQKDALEIFPIVLRHAGVFGPEAVRTALAARDAAFDPAERRRATALAEAVAELCMGRELALPADELATAQAQATVTVDGETMPYHGAAIAVQNETDRERRRALEEARLAVTAGFDPLRERLLRRHHELIGELGFEGYTTFYSSLKGIDLRALGEVMAGFLDRTRDLYIEHIGPWFEEVIGVPFAEAERHDASVLFRMRERDASFRAERMVPALRETLLRLGVALDDQPNVHLDTEERPRKNPRAFCVAVRAPEEVYLVTRPTGGYQDWRSLFHEAGHTEHFAHVEAARPFEERQLGDSSVTEAYAFSLEHLLLDAPWLAEHAELGGEELSTFLHRAHVYYLYMIRRYAAKLLYELELHGAGPQGWAAMPRRYAALLTEHLGFASPTETWLDDVDPGFYASQYLRAWMLEAQLRERWHRRSGDRWWAAAETGGEMRTLWSMGQALPADLLAAELGMDGLGIDALERRIREGLRGRSDEAADGAAPR
jgi:hypothetical protein